MRLLLAPRETYAALMRIPSSMSPLAALRRPLLAAVVLGVSVAIAGTGRVTPGLVVATTIGWSYMILVQLAVAMPLLVAGGATRTVGLARAVDLFFAGHAPWSLFVLFAAAWASSPFGRPPLPLLVAAALALAVTTRILTAFFGEVLHMAPARARRWMGIHQIVTWTLFVALVWFESALTPRVFEVVGRL